MHNPYLLKFLESEGFKDYEEYKKIDEEFTWSEKLSLSIEKTTKRMEQISEATKKLTIGDYADIQAYKDEMERLRKLTPFYNRQELVNEFAWAVPTEEAIDEITEFLGGQVVIDIASGTGYWSYLLKQKGNIPIAVDIEPREKPWFDTLSLNVTTLYRKLEVFNNAALMFCWPPYSEPMAYRVLKKYQGNKVIYIGEGHGGCTADDAFHELLDADYQEVKEVVIPQFNGLHDKMWFFERNNNA
jgi:hypothetical protein